jgi:hypothetical protein
MRKPTARDHALSNIVKSVLQLTGRNELIFVDPLVRGDGKKRGSEMLGWGVPSDIQLLTPVLIEFLRSKEFIDFWKEAGKGALNALAEHVGGKVVKHLTDQHERKLDTTKLQLLREDFSARLEASGFDKQEVTVAGAQLVAVLASHPDWAQALVTD